MKQWIKRVPDLSAVVSRFPIVAGIMALFTLIIIVLDPGSSDENIGRLLVGLVIAAYVGFCVTIIGEAKQGSPRYVLQVVLAIIIAALAWFSERLHINLFMAVAAVLLALGNMVLWRKGRDDLHVWDFTHKIWTGAVFATVGSIIFLIGIFAIQAALKSLFGIKIDDLMEDFILPIGFGFLAPLYWLSTVPKTDEDYQELYDKPGFVSQAVAFFGTWLLSPLTLIYALILLAYAGKIILAGSLPKGEIAGLTTPFLVIGTLTWLVLEPPFIKDKFLAKLFRRSWFFLSIPAALLLAVSVWVRIYNYGLTVERFALAMAVLWALGVGLWFTIGPKTKRDIRYIPGLACLLFIIGTFTAQGFSLMSQGARLNNNLKPAGIVSAENTITTDKIIDKKAAQNVKGAIEYMFRQNGERGLKHILGRYGYEGEISRKAVMEALGIDNLKMPNRYSSKYKQRNYNSQNKPVNIKDYTLLTGLHHAYFSSNFDSVIYNGDVYKIKNKSNRLNFYLKEELLESFDVKDWVKTLPVEELNEDKFVLDTPVIDIFDNEKLTLTLHIQSIDETTHEDGDNNMSITFFMLIKEKEAS